MNNKARIFQAILFEVLALLLSFGWVKLIGLLGYGHAETTNQSSIWLMLVAISLIAMVWSFTYNKIFDHFFTEEKLQRPIWLRMLHIVGFEGGLLCFTLPLVMWVMGLGIWEALMLDISLTLLILVYGFIFYWVYDWIMAMYFSGSTDNRR